jgi:hypothetical protein
MARTNELYLSFPFLVSQVVLIFMREYLTTRLSSFCIFDPDTIRVPAWTMNSFYLFPALLSASPLIHSAA